MADRLVSKTSEGNLVRVRLPLPAPYSMTSHHTPLVIGIAGGTGSGKTTLARKLLHHFKENAVCVAHDSYYRDQSTLSLEERKRTNYDHPDALETPLLVRQLRQLMRNKSIHVPVYDFSQHTRGSATITVLPQKIIILEGILIFHEEALRRLMDLKIFVDTDADIRLGRRIVRDIQERGRTLEFSLHQYLTMSKPMHEAFVEPSKRFADVIIPEGGHNVLGLKVLVNTISQMMKDH